MSGWSCRFDVNGICERVDGAYCRPGMKGCILYGKVTFHDGVVPAPVWPPESGRCHRKDEADGGEPPPTRPE